MRLPLDAGAVGMVPPAIADVVTALARREPLVPVATLHTDRTAYVLHDRDGQAVAELVDDIVSIMDGEVVAGRFRELEVEALTEDSAVLEPIVALLMAHGATAGTSSKAGSALGPAAKLPPDVLPPGTVTPHDPAGAAVTAHIRTHVRRFLLQDVRVRRDLPDSVHQMRVAARRLRSGLRVFGPLVDPGWARNLRDELGWAASGLGLSRDSEVLMARLDAHADKLDSPVDSQAIHEHVDPVMGQRVAAGRAEALDAMRSERHLDLLDALVAAAAQPRLTPAAAHPSGHVLPPLFGKSWRKLAKEVDRLTLDGPAAQWHETRITAKRARYAAEALVPVFGPPAKALASALAEVTEQLGEHQDAYIAQETCRELAAQFDGSTGFALGRLHAYETECELIARVRLQEAWPMVRGLAKRTKLR
jgi:CHAD domain-containing protein